MRIGNWLLRLLKGAIIGIGAILPGVSGGALAAVFGIYERMIGFLADVRKDFRENARFFLPVGIGGLLGIFVLSFGVSRMLERAEALVLWFFIGCIGGTLPALWRQAGRKGRKPGHLLLTAVSAVGIFLLMRQGDALFTITGRGIGTWLLAGVIIGLGVVAPGLSPSNLLVYLGLYQPMTEGITRLDLGIILPVGIGGAACVLLLSKAMEALFRRAYAGLFHVILGALLASTLIIVPQNIAYNRQGVALCVVNAVAGVALGLWMSRLEQDYK